MPRSKRRPHSFRQWLDHVRWPWVTRSHFEDTIAILEHLLDQREEMLARVCAELVELRRNRSTCPTEKEPRQ